MCLLLQLCLHLYLRRPYHLLLQRRTKPLEVRAGQMLPPPPVFANTSTRADIVRNAFKVSWLASFQRMSQRQMAVDLIAGHVRAAQVVAAILDNPEDTKRVNLLYAELNAARAKLVTPRTEQAVSFAKLTAVRAELAASRSEAASLKDRCRVLDGKLKHAVATLESMNT
ncbi:hypothetical protein F0562_032362 [Nyssa sinensis]|uniref:Uncharacterized protein n=1 Tax=Nyssa sinensis TaxID=561372 RepID=A0A5J5AN00_9ASTE|nr:hypothetical protein F0562_032362 [Nyssa sinensis]